MPKLSLKSGTTSKTVNLFFQSSLSTTGAGQPGITNNNTGLLAHFIREGDSASTPIAITSAAIGTWTTGGLVEIESSAMPGMYQFGLPNAICSAGNNAKSAVLYIFGASGMAPCISEIEITQVDNQDGTRFGLTALPNAAAAASNGLLTSGTGANQISTSAGAVLIQAGAAAGQLDFTAGVVKANATQWVGGTIPSPNVTGVPLVDDKYLLGTIYSTPATAGIMDVNLKNIANAAVSTTTAQLGVNTVKYNNQTAVTDGNNYPSVNVVDISGSASTGSSGYVGIDWGQVTNKTASVDLTQTIISSVSGNVAGSVGSVTGAVGSVTGNVGGNVTGSVGSVVATVNANVNSWAGTGIVTPNVSGVPIVDTTYFKGTTSTGQAGSVGIDWSQILNKTAVVDLTQTIISRVSGDVGGNVVGSVGSVTASVNANVNSWAGTGIVTPNVSGVPVVDTTYFRGTTSTGQAGSVGLDWGQIVNKTTVVDLTQTIISAVSGSVQSVTSPVAITSNVKKNVIVSGFPFVMTDNTTHIPRAGLSVTGNVSKDGGAFNALVGAVGEIGSGWYQVNLAATEVNANNVALRFVATSADDRDILVVTQP